MEAKRLSVVKDGYMPTRVAGDKGPGLVKFFAKDGVLIDINGKRHCGEAELLAYYAENQTAPTSVDEPKVHADGTITVRFKYYKMWLATFTFVKDSSLIQLITLKGDGLW